MSVQVLTAPLPVWLTADVPGGTAEDGLSTWVAAPHVGKVGDQGGIPGPGFIGRVNQQMEGLCLSLSL